MHTIHTVAAMKAQAREWRAAGKRIGFVPTMGYLHAGHLSLVEEARRRADVVVVSIYVNPTQFGPSEDLTRYPRDLARDLALLAPLGVDAVFFPSDAEMYPPGSCTFVQVEGLTRALCGASRPGHFRGVATIVAKLFTVVTPDLAVFGLKDYQQFQVIRRMARDLFLDVEVLGLPTVREADGLAMSSRNVFLSPEARAAALAIPRGLQQAAQGLAGGADVAQVEAAYRAELEAAGGRVDYVTVADAESVEPVTQTAPGGRYVIAVAAFFGPTRLIDNRVVERG
jgi:pantoate--beta-alanine ligase